MVSACIWGREGGRSKSAVWHKPAVKLYRGANLAPFATENGNKGDMDNDSLGKTPSEDWKGGKRVRSSMCSNADTREGHACMCTCTSHARSVRRLKLVIARNKALKALRRPICSSCG